MDAILFYVFAAIAVVSAVGVIAQRHPIHSAFSLVVGRRAANIMERKTAMRRTAVKR